MACRRTRALLSDYLDERLPLATCGEIRRHLDACAACRAEWEELAALKTMLAKAKTPEAPIGFWDRVYQELHREAARRRASCPTTPWILVWQRAPALAAGLAALSTAILLPLTTTPATWTAPALDARSALAHHAAYTPQPTLDDRTRLGHIVADIRLSVLD